MKIVLANPHLQPYQSTTNTFNPVDANHLLIQYLLSRDAFQNIDSKLSVQDVLDKYRGLALPLKGSLLKEYLFPRDVFSNQDERLSTAEVNRIFKHLFREGGSSLNVTGYSPRRSCITNMVSWNMDKNNYNTGFEHVIKWIGWAFTSLTVRKYIDDLIKKKMKIGEMILGEREYILDDNDDDDEDEKEDEDPTQLSDDNTTDEDASSVPVEYNDEMTINFDPNNTPQISFDNFFKNDSTNYDESYSSTQVEQDKENIPGLPGRLYSSIRNAFAAAMETVVSENEDEIRFTETISASRKDMNRVENKFITYLARQHIDLQILQHRYKHEHPNTCHTAENIRRIILPNYFSEHEQEIYETVEHYFSNKYNELFFQKDNSYDIFRKGITIPDIIYRKALEFSKKSSSSSASSSEYKMNRDNLNVIYPLAKEFINQNSIAKKRFEKMALNDDLVEYYRMKLCVIVLIKEHYLNGDKVFLCMENRLTDNWKTYHIPESDVLDNLPSSDWKVGTNYLLPKGYKEKFIVDAKVVKNEARPTRFMELEVLSGTAFTLHEYSSEAKLLHSFTGGIMKIDKESKIRFINYNLYFKSEDCRKKFEKVKNIEQFYNPRGCYYPISNPYLSDIEKLDPEYIEQLNLELGLCTTADQSSLQVLLDYLGTLSTLPLCVTILLGELKEVKNSAAIARKKKSRNKQKEKFKDNKRKKYLEVDDSTEAETSTNGDNVPEDAKDLTPKTKKRKGDNSKSNKKK